MAMPITRYGLREVLLIVLFFGILGVLGWFIWPAGRPWPSLAMFFLGFLLVCFFRDPDRSVPSDDRVLVAPADGRVTDVCEVADGVEFLTGPAVRIGIFLSVFDVHMNRSPCAGRVSYTKSHPGRCHNALSWELACRENQAHSLGLDCPDHPACRVLVKQITGAIARRIVCAVGLGDSLCIGERFGMIKFGSRTELYIPADDSAVILVAPGDVVRAGVTVMVRYGPDGGLASDEC